MKKIWVTLALIASLSFSACQLPALGGQSGVSDVSNEVSSQQSSSSSDLLSSSEENSTDAQEHKDSNDDGVCDDCMESVTVDFDIFAINDLHGKFMDTTAQIGVDEMSTYFAQTRAKNPNTILLSSGDMWQGSPESNLTRGNIINDWMNEMEFVAMTLGNHEFDWGEEHIRANAGLAEFPYLAINVMDKYTEKRVDYCQPSVTIKDENSGVSIGIIGAIGDCYSSISSDMVEGVYFVNGFALNALVKAEARRLREEGADFIVYSLHGSHLEQGEYSAELSDYVDLVFEGHTHQGYSKLDAKGVYHLQNAGDNGGVSHAEVTINYVTGTSEVTRARVVQPTTYAALDDHPVVDTLLTKYEREVAKASEVLGQNAVARGSEALCALTAKLYYEKGLETWSDKDIVLGGGFLKLRAPYKLDRGSVTYGALVNILPFDNPIVLCSIRGWDLKDKFLGGRANYAVYCDEGEQALANKIEDNETYYIVTDTYTSQYSYNNLTEVARLDEVTYARDLLADYIKKGGLQ